MIIFKFQNIKGSTNLGEYKECVLLNSIEFSIGRKGSQVEKQPAPRRFGLKFCDSIVISRISDSDTRWLINQSLLCTISNAVIYNLETNNRCHTMIELSDCLINDIKISWHGTICTETFYLTFSEINYRIIPLVGTPGGAGFNLMSGEGA